MAAKKTDHQGVLNYITARDPGTFFAPGDIAKALGRTPDSVGHSLRYWYRRGELGKLGDMYRTRRDGEHFSPDDFPEEPVKDSRSLVRDGIREFFRMHGYVGVWTARQVWQGHTDLRDRKLKRIIEGLEAMSSGEKSTLVTKATDSDGKVTWRWSIEPPPVDPGLFDSPAEKIMTRCRRINDDLEETRMQKKLNILRDNAPPSLDISAYDDASVKRQELMDVVHELRYLAFKWFDEGRYEGAKTFRALSRQVEAVNPIE